jgi:deoxyadenosine/deoxycytidine kinase
MAPKIDFEKVVNSVIEAIRPMDEKDALKQIWDEAESLEELLHKHNPVIMIAGNIGLGKTTTARIISTFGKTRIDREDADKELLRLYYDNMKRYAERLQIDLIAQRLNHIAVNNLLYHDQPFVYDRTPYEDPLIFAKALQTYEQMSPEALNFCYDYFLIKKRELERAFPGVRFEPDLIILLNSSIENGWKRVNIRRRDMEVKQDTRKGHGLTFEFYKLLHGYYESFVDELAERGWYDGPILRLQEDEFEVADVTNTKGQLYVIKSVKEALKALNG